MAHKFSQGAGDEEAFACPHCGSTQVRRSSPYGLAEQLLRSFTPFHFYRCRACGRRGMYVGRRLRGRSAAGGRPVESRDLRAARRRRQRWFAMLVLALGLGAAAGLYVNSCQDQFEQVQPVQ